MFDEEKLRSFLLDNVGKSNCLFDSCDMFFYSQDASPLISNIPPVAVIKPDGVQVISRVLRYCNDNEIPVTIRGAGTSLSGNSIPLRGGLVIDTTGLNRVLDFKPESRIVIVEPGVVCDDLNAWLSEKGCFFAPDPGSSSVCTIGGMVANNSGGIQAAKYGVTKSHVVWLEAIMADGTISILGSRALKSSSSLALQDMLVGSEGCIAFISKIAIRVLPVPETRKTFVIGFDDLQDAIQFTSTIQSTGFVPSMMEFMDDVTTNAVLKFIDEPRYPFQGKVLIMLEMDGTSKEVDENALKVREIIARLEQAGVKVSTIEAKPGERDSVIALRKSALPALARLNRTVLIEDCSVLLKDIPLVVRDIKNSCGDACIPDFHVAVFGHIGDGNLHPTFVFNGMDDNHLKILFKSMSALYDEIIPRVDGSITGEHGIGIIKAPYLRHEHASALDIMHKIKAVFDPKGILNPLKGKSGYIPESLESVFETYFPLNKVDNTILSKFVGYDNNCMKCGFCRLQCPSLSYYGWECYSPRARLSLLQGIALNRVVLGNDLAKKFMSCMLCDRCHVSCPAGIETSSIFEKFREVLANISPETAGSARKKGS
ncbi:MAG: FAD-linked oxidase C-terminal domain-containing protein [Candidatus Sigynarchaeota archaeon]